MLHDYNKTQPQSCFPTSRQSTLFSRLYGLYITRVAPKTLHNTLLGNVTALSTAVAFPYLSANLQVFCLFIFFGKFASDWASAIANTIWNSEQLELGASFPPPSSSLHLTIIGSSGSIRREGGVNMNTSFKRLRKEMQVKEVDEMIVLGANKENIRDWRAVIKGLSSTHFNTTE